MGEWIVWQLIDSAFPSGGFVHSSGVEAASQLGFIKDKTALDKFLKSYLSQTMNTSMKLMFGVYSKNISVFEEVDNTAQAVTCNHVANRASRAQGQALLSSATTAFPDSGLQLYKRKIFSLCGHYAPVFGLVCKLLDVNVDTVRRMYLFVTLRGLLSSAVRLNLIGPLEAQNVHYRYAPLIDSLLKDDSSSDTNTIYQTAPLLDIIHGAHDRLYSRLFNT